MLTIPFHRSIDLASRVPNEWKSLRLCPFKSPFLLRTEYCYNSVSRFNAAPRHSTPSSGASIVWTSDNCPDRSEEKQISLRLGKAVVAAVLFHRKSGTIGAAVGLCRKKTESRGVNIIRGRKGHGGRRLNTPPRPYDLPTFFPPQSRWNLLVIFPVFLARRGSLFIFHRF